VETAGDLHLLDGAADANDQSARLAACEDDFDGRI
jgi:hypothetical protein